MNLFKIILIAAIGLVLSACVSSDGTSVLSSAVEQPAQLPLVQNPQSAQAYAEIPTQSPQPQSGYNNSYALQTPDPMQEARLIRPSRTYLINGLASSVEAIGYGFKNLQKKIPGSQLFSYVSPVESSTVIRSQVIKEIKAAYSANPNLNINLIGISYGANIVTQIAANLGRANIPVNYLATLEGPAMSRIGENVKVVDNFNCTVIPCFRTKSKLKSSNRSTRYESFTLNTTHIALADHPKVHARILSQIRKNNVLQTQILPQ